MYDAERDRFYDFREIEDESRYPDLQEVLDAYHVGKRLGGEPLFKDAFYRYASWEGEPYNDVISYSELAYHIDPFGGLRWVLVQGDTNISQETLCYEVVGDRVYFTAYDMERWSVCLKSMKLDGSDLTLLAHGVSFAEG